MIGQSICMCECAEIAQGKQKLAWELNHLSSVPLSEKPRHLSARPLLFSRHPFILQRKYYHSSTGCTAVYGITCTSLSRVH